MQGKIIKGISGFYYVYVEETGVYECKAKGIFRNQKMKPLVGDNVIIASIDEENRIGNVEQILPRKNALIRPAVANIDMALVIFAADKPAPNLNLLDRFLCVMEFQKVPVTICFNKSDLVTGEEMVKLKGIYNPAGYEILFTCAKEGIGVEKLRQCLYGKTTVVAGPSGVGKSSLVNKLQSGITMETGQISTKIERGKHTTRHSQIIPVCEHTYIMDTPGFSSMDVPSLNKERLWTCYPEFLQYEPDCRFRGCMHIHEPDCGIKQALEQGKISKVRYNNYMLLYEEMKKTRKY